MSIKMKSHFSLCPFVFSLAYKSLQLSNIITRGKEEEVGGKEMTPLRSLCLIFLAQTDGEIIQSYCQSKPNSQIEA